MSKDKCKCKKEKVKKGQKANVFHTMDCELRKEKK